MAQHSAQSAYTRYAIMQRYDTRMRKGSDADDGGGGESGGVGGGSARIRRRQQIINVMMCGCYLLSIILW